MKKFIIVLFCIFVGFQQFCNAKGFVIFIDQESYKQAKGEVESYAKTVQQVHGLKVYTVIDQWGVPDSIRKCLQNLYLKKKINGVVFIGDIPIAMIRDAQHLTSAFKMDQRQAREESSVPSDRFYDDFGLKFNYEGQDKGTPLFYYSLRGDGDQRIHCDLFSGRIRPTDSGGLNRYEKLRRYLRKVVREKLSKNYLDKVFFFTGSGTLSESRVAAMDEKATYYEHFPWLKDSPIESISYLDYSYDPYIKPRLMNELQRPDLDLAILHHHGDYDTQYLSKSHVDVSNKVDSINKDLRLSDFSSWKFKPNCKIVIFDACYNGSFQMNDCIANEYIFSEGETVACMAATVNILQDKWYDHLIGLLGLGFNIGEINKYQYELESHIIGDPTATFTVKKSVNAKQCSDRKAYDMIIKDERNKLSSEDLLKAIQYSPYTEVRLQALELLAENHHGDDFVRGLEFASWDQAEMVQRFAVNYIRQSGDVRLAEPLMRLYLGNHTPERVSFDAQQAVMFFPKSVIEKAFWKIFTPLLLVDKDSLKNQYLNSIYHDCDYWDKDVSKLISDTLSDTRFNFIASCMRLYCPHTRIPDILKYIDDSRHKEERRQMLIEAMGWYSYSYQAPLISATALKLSKDLSLSKKLREEALKTYNRTK